MQTIGKSGSISRGASRLPTRQVAGQAVSVTAPCIWFGSLQKGARIFPEEANRVTTVAKRAINESLNIEVIFNDQNQQCHPPLASQEVSDCSPLIGTSTTPRGSLRLRCQMGRFYFHVKEGNELIADEDGTDLPDLAAATREALQAARELLAEAIKLGKPTSPEAIVVADAGGRTLFELPFIGVLPEPIKKQCIG
jgi:hypothetical protein